MTARARVERVAKTAAAHALHWTGLDRLTGGGSPLVLCYHRVVEDVRRYPGNAPAMLVGRRTLERQLGWVGRRYRFVGLDELARALESGERPRRPVAAVTFDDGYADVHSVGFPLLARMGIPFAVFVPTDWIGTDALQVHDELYLRLLSARRARGARGLASLLEAAGVAAAQARALEGPGAARRLVELKEGLLLGWPRERVGRLIAALDDGEPIPPARRAELRAMSWEMLAELRRAGVVVGSHTVSHRTLPNQPESEIVAELVESKRTLDRRLGGETLHLAYPGGQFCPFCVESAHAAGYRYAYTTCGHRSAARPLLTIPRRTLWERSCAGLVGDFSPAIAGCHVHGVFERLRPCRAAHRARGRERETGRPALGWAAQ
jgi:peptidoglycan/xylan/chitin deacetylase (PgdA/CDA1 family)